MEDGRREKSTKQREKPGSQGEKEPNPVFGNYTCPHAEYKKQQEWYQPRKILESNYKGGYYGVWTMECQWYFIQKNDIIIFNGFAFQTFLKDSLISLYRKMTLKDYFDLCEE